MIPAARCAAQQLVSSRGRIGRLRSGVRLMRTQAQSYAQHWDEGNRAVAARQGPLWVVLGDSAAQGVGAARADAGYVGQLRRQLEARDGVPWRVLNLSASGALIADVRAHQLPALPTDGADLVTCAVGANDLVRLPLARIEADLCALIDELPAGTVLATMPHGLGARRTARLNALVRQLAPAAGLGVADVWAHTSSRSRGDLAEDFFHPSEAGYARWAQAFAEVVAAHDEPAR